MLSDIVKFCVRCDEPLIECAYHIVGIETDASDYIYDYDSPLCNACWDLEYTKDNIQPLEHYESLAVSHDGYSYKGELIFTNTNTPKGR